MEQQQNSAPPEEEWRDIPSCPGYQASSLGRIRSVDRTSAFMIEGRPFSRRLRGRVLSPKTDRGGYLEVQPRRGSMKLVHRLVCEAFYGPCPEGYQAAHGNGVRTDNRASNLRWASPKENQRDRIAHGTALRGEGITSAKLTAADVIAIRSAEGFQREIAARFGVTQTNVSQIKRGTTWKHVHFAHQQTQGTRP